MNYDDIIEGMLTDEEYLELYNNILEDSSLVAYYTGCYYTRAEGYVCYSDYGATINK